jgi:YfiH family protein
MDLSNDQVIHQVRGGVEFLQFRRLLDYQDKLTHVYSLGVKVNYRTEEPNKEPLDEKEYRARKNDYDLLMKAIGWEKKQIIKTNQEHTDEIKIYTTKEKMNEPDWKLSRYSQTDGLITNQRNALLATTNADCLLLLFYDPVTNTIANVHSGWRGTVQKIAEKTVKKMKTEFACQPENIICCLSPSIRMCHFEVGEEVKDLFVSQFGEWGEVENWLVKVKSESNQEEKEQNQRTDSEEEKEENKSQKKEEHELRSKESKIQISEVNELRNEETKRQNNEGNEPRSQEGKMPKWRIDTAKLNQMMLEKQGLKPENIIDCGICSMCHSDQIHSYRAEKEGYGLEVALIGLNEKKCNK